MHDFLLNVPFLFPSWVLTLLNFYGMCLSPAPYRALTFFSFFTSVDPALELCRLWQLWICSSIFCWYFVCGKWWRSQLSQISVILYVYLGKLGLGYNWNSWTCQSLFRLIEPFVFSLPVLRCVLLIFSCNITAYCSFLASFSEWTFKPNTRPRKEWY